MAHAMVRRELGTLLLLLLSMSLPPTAATATVAESTCPTLLNHSFTPIQGGASQAMCQYRGKVLLIVNTASQCGYTNQYEGLEALYRKYRNRGLVVVGFPSNDFGGQEPGTNQEIAQFCRTVYGVQFPMFEKQSAGRLSANPLYGQLIGKTSQSPKVELPQICRRSQRVAVTSFKSDTAPDDRDLVGLIERLARGKPTLSAS